MINPRFYTTPVKLETILLTHATAGQFPNPALVMDLIKIYPPCAPAMRAYLAELRRLDKIMKGLDEVVARMAVMTTIRQYPNKTIEPLSVAAVQERNRLAQEAEVHRAAMLKKFRGAPRDYEPKDHVPKPYSRRPPHSEDMTAHELHYLASYKFGRRWEQPVAALVGVNNATVSRWLNGHHKIPLMAAKLIRRECAIPETENVEVEVEAAASSRQD